MQVGNATVVTLLYTLKEEGGDVIETITSQSPLQYLHGAGNIIEGLEDGLEGLECGEEFDILVESRYGYGEFQRTLVTHLERSRFPEDDELQVGQTFALDSPRGKRMIKILDIQGERVKVDGNHELAGKTLRYKGKVLEVREASEDEMGNGYVRESGV